jgi:large subunit ribosomal protein L4
MATTTFTASGAKATTAASLPKSVFAVEVNNHQLLKDAYLAHLANGRVNLAKTLNRGDVSGGGIKPWRQKGTGRARFGSSRNPIWRTGGVVFGPTGAENYTRKLNVTAKRRALTQALSLANSSKNLVVIEDFVVKDGKTKTAAALLAKIGTPSRVVIVVTTKTPELVRATANLPEVIVSTANGLNVYDVLNASHIVITKDAIAAIEARLTGGTK